MLKKTHENKKNKLKLKTFNVKIYNVVNMYSFYFQFMLSLAWTAVEN